MYIRPTMLRKTALAHKSKEVSGKHNYSCNKYWRCGGRLRDESRSKGSLVTFLLAPSFKVVEEREMCYL
jgi:hypothetical protein